MVMDQRRSRMDAVHHNNNTNYRVNFDLDKIQMCPLEYKPINVVKRTSSQTSQQSPISSISTNNFKRIVLNAPFIKLDPIKTNAIRKTQQPQGTSSNGSSEDEEEGSSSSASSSESDKSMSISNNIPKAASSNASSVEENKGTRLLPKRRCKEKPFAQKTTTTTNDKTAAPKKDKANPNPRPKSAKSEKRKQAKGTNKLSRNTRASFRLTEKLKKAAKDAANAKRRPCLRVSRTVELVDQKDESWRDEKSKLLYMLSLGLTPIMERSAINSTPQVNLTVIPPEVLEKARDKYNREQAQYQLKRKALRRLWRERRAKVIRDRAAQRLLPSSQSMEVEVIDLSDNEGNQARPKFEDTNNFKGVYPNLTIELTQLQQKNSTSSKRPKSPKISPPKQCLVIPSRKEGSKVPTHFAVPKLVKSMVANSGEVRIPLRNIPVKRPKPCIYVAPSPPMVVSPDDYNSIISARNKQTSTGPTGRLDRHWSKRNAGFPSSHNYDLDEVIVLE